MPLHPAYPSLQPHRADGSRSVLAKLVGQLGNRFSQLPGERSGLAEIIGGRAFAFENPSQ